MRLLLMLLMLIVFSHDFVSLLRLLRFTLACLVSDVIHLIATRMSDFLFS